MLLVIAFCLLVLVFVDRFAHDREVEQLREEIQRLEVRASRFTPYFDFDDSEFVDIAATLEGKTLGFAIDFAKEHHRALTVNETERGGFFGVDLYSLDNHTISISTEPIHPNLRPLTGWDIDQLRKMKIRVVNIYDLDAMNQHDNRFTFD